MVLGQNFIQSLIPGLKKYKVSNYISGIIFIEDNLILSKYPNKTNVKSYIYHNPNAINPIKNSLAWDFLMALQNIDFDDFENDNY